MPTAPLLHVEVSGAGEPTVVLMHGFAGSARNLRPQARFLKARHRVVLFDARGHARSAAPADAAAYDIDAFVGDVQDVIGQVGASSVVLGGISMGAAVALQYTLRYPDRVRALVLASFPPADDATSSWASTLAESIERDGMEAAGEKLVWGGARFDPEAAKWIRQGFLEHRASALSAVLRNLLAVQPPVSKLEKSLASLSVPALVIVGEDDTRSIEPSRDLVRFLPHAQLVVIAGAGHTVNLEKPELFNGALGEFLTKLEA